MDRSSEEIQLADRFSSYADAIAAVAFVNALAFAVAIADQEVRCSLLNVRGLVVSGGLVLHAAYASAILVFRRGELRLRAADGQTHSALVGRYKGRLHAARLGFVALLAVMSVLVAWYGLPDPSCGA